MRSMIFRKEKCRGDERVEVELPKEVLAGFGWQEADVPKKLRETLMMKLLRQHILSREVDSRSWFKEQET